MSRRDLMLEEAQLLAEEKWILNALSKIRQQRNSLQIERLHLENLKAKYYPSPLPHGSLSGKGKEKQESTKDNGQQECAQDKGNKIQPVVTMPTQTAVVSSAQLSTYERKLTEQIVDTLCNDEELDLAVSTSAFTQNMARDNNFEESDDEDDDDDVMVDIDMFMSDSFRRTQDE